jgi:hypothetical protein
MPSDATMLHTRWEVEQQTWQAWLADVPMCWLFREYNKGLIT